VPAASKRTIHFVSLGCPKNRVDTEIMLGVSGEVGYQHVDDPANAEVIVVNTCGFVEAAKQESIETILALSDMKQSGACKKLVVAGCLSQRYPDELKKGLPEVDHFLGSSDMLVLGKVLTQAKTPKMLVGNPADHLARASDPRVLSLHRHYAYLKIAEGCSRKCSFCAIPSFRGTQRSRPIDDLVAEAKQLAAQGVVELNVISQDTISYGKDLSGDAVGRGQKSKRALVPLARALSEVEGIEWVRLFYLYPEAFSDELIDVLRGGTKVVPYVDMPMQHATDRMLKIMRRGYNEKKQRELIERLRAVDGLCIRSAFIVGHPGETDKDFAQLCDFVRASELDHVGVFRYSHEDGTHSGTLDELVPDEIIEARANELMAIQQKISKKRLKARIGDEITVLVEGESDESELLLQGRHAGQAPEVDGVVILTNGTADVGELRRAKVTHATEYDLVAKLLGEERAGRETSKKASAKKAAKTSTVRSTRLPIVR
jgi:ribosomal protein S12 methylthiotransferase